MLLTPGNAEPQVCDCEMLSIVDVHCACARTGVIQASLLHVEGVSTFETVVPYCSQDWAEAMSLCASK